MGRQDNELRADKMKIATFGKGKQLIKAKRNLCESKRIRFLCVAKPLDIMVLLRNKEIHSLNSIKKHSVTPFPGVLG